MGRLVLRLGLVLIVFVVGWLVSRILELARPSRPPVGRAGGGEALVRDRVCNTFLPRSRAIRVVERDGERWFCSESCRDAARRRRPAPGLPAAPTV